MIEAPVRNGPRIRVCYICGRQYGVHSYEIHLRQCKELWVQREALKEPRDRKPLPIDPSLIPSKLISGSTSKSNKGKEKSEHDESECHHDAIFKTEKSSNATVSLDEMNKLASEAFNAVALNRCEFCGRTFLAEKLAIHNKSCTASNPCRRVDEPVRRGKETFTHTNTTEFLPPKSAKKPSTPASSAKICRQGLRARIVQMDHNDGLVPELVTNENLLTPLSGHLGGLAGRDIREQRSRPSSQGADDGNIGDDGEAGTESTEVVIRRLTEKLSKMETMAKSLTDGIKEVRSVLLRLQAP